MKYYDLNKEEKQILEDFERDDFKSVKDLKKQKDSYVKYAKSTLAKARNINIRLSEKDLQKAKIKAADQGIPYQTLITSVVHRYVNDRIKLKG
ncbi:MAG: hypothetical protein ABIA91_01255 [Patescibacteria group bacterium]